MPGLGLPHDLAGFLVQVEGVCETWRRWAEELSRDADEVNEKHVFLDDLPREFVQKMMARQPEHRYATPAEVAEALDQVLRAE